MDALLLVLLHLGDLHAVEKVLVGVVAFGPFVVLGIVVYLVRKRDLAAEEEPDGTARDGAPPGPAGG